ncbi:hypothetical protein [Scytonema sp. PRP1]
MTFASSQQLFDEGEYGYPNTSCAAILLYFRTCLTFVTASGCKAIRIYT